MSAAEHRLQLRLQCRPGGGSFELRVEGDWRWQGVLGISGPSGCGKTSLLMAIAGLLPGCRGELRYDGQSLLDGVRALPAHRRHIACVFQEPRLFPHLGVIGNLRYGQRRNGGSLDLDSVVRLLRLQPLLSRSTAGLSGGEAQRVALGRALLAAPRLLLLDEPLCALDPELREEILQAIRDIRDRLALPMIYVSHSVEELRALAEKSIVLKPTNREAPIQWTAPAPLLGPA